MRASGRERQRASGLTKRSASVLVVGREVAEARRAPSDILVVTQRKWWQPARDMRKIWSRSIVTDGAQLADVAIALAQQCGGGKHAAIGEGRNSTAISASLSSSPAIGGRIIGRVSLTPKRAVIAQHAFTGASEPRNSVSGSTCADE